MSREKEKPPYGRRLHALISHSIKQERDTPLYTAPKEFYIFLLLAPVK
jgi:hypothetical protein